MSVRARLLVAPLLSVIAIGCSEESTAAKTTTVTSVEKTSEKKPSRKVRPKILKQQTGPEAIVE